MVLHEPGQWFIGYIQELLLTPDAQLESQYFQLDLGTVGHVHDAAMVSREDLDGRSTIYELLLDGDEV